MTESAMTRLAPVAVVMGVAGSGKSTVGPELAEHLGVPFRDADSFHPQANIDKMHAGQPLTDEDREPWLAAIAEWVDENRARGCIVSCSALKRTYRDQLRAHVPDLPFLHLAGAEGVAADRVGSRPDHFMPASLVHDQYVTLQPLAADEVGETVDFTRPIDEICREFEQFLVAHPIARTTEVPA